MATNGSSETNDRPTNGHQNQYSLQSIVDDFMRDQLALKGYEWTPSDTNGVSNDSDLSQTFTSSQRTKIVDGLKSLGRYYLQLYETQLNEMCDQLDVSPSTAFSTFNSLSNELFIEGIKWNHIITYLVFGSQFAFKSIQNGFPNLVNEVSHWMTTYIQTNLDQWIADNGGMEYIIELAAEKVGRPADGGHSKLIYGTAGAIGAAAGALALGLFLRNLNSFK